MAFGGLIKEEGDKLLHVLNEYALVLGIIIILVLSYLNRAKLTLPNLKKLLDLFALIAAIMLLIQLLAIPLEISDKVDFGNDIPGVIVVTATLLNRFL